MKGNEIILTSAPRGIFLEGIITDTSKPGTCMEIVPGTAPKGGRHSWRASTLAQGRPRMIAILLPDQLQGKGPTDAYVASTRCFLYCPIAGEELNVLVDIVGTGTGATTGASIGELLEANPNGHFTLEVSVTAPCPFVSMENVADIATGPQAVLVWSIYTGG